MALAIFVALLALVYFAYRKDADQARGRVNAGSQIAQTNCGPIEYTTAGNGPPVLVVHGAGGGFDQGLEVARLLIESGFQVIAPSRFGYLRTPMPEKRDRLAETQADAHACLLDTLELSRVAVFSVSAGAPSSMRFCLERPARCSALVLMVPAYPATPTGEQRELSVFARFFLETTLRPDFIFWTLISIAPDTMTRMILGTPPEGVKRASPAEQVRVRAMLWHILPVSRRADGLRYEAASIANAPGLEELKLQLGRKLRERREARKMTQVELARRLKSSQSRVAKIELEIPPFRLISSCARSFRLAQTNVILRG